ncbi:hypothetical protein DY000_02016492 [Brassica cretica]|uniref:Secreted protein n=1 Tax=Brassica cretica TaxID=69181 RepID=A0ABQ7CYV7_BRACR|nr:hypothetical protein DY000_02016492 [Brassica cretica]
MHSGCSARLFCVKITKLHCFLPLLFQLVHLPSNATPNLPAWRMAELDLARDQLGHPPSWIEHATSSAIRRARPNTRPARPSAELERSCCHSPVLVAPSIGIGSNLLLFHLNQSHRRNFTI